MREALRNRRQFLRHAAFSAAAGSAARVGRAAGCRSACERPRIGVVGCGSRWNQRAAGIADGRWGAGKYFAPFGDIVAVCDVDAARCGRAAELVAEWLGPKPAIGQDYRRIIDDPCIDVVHVATPDHWHAKLAVEAMLAGKDVYCEKPLTLTIDEGRLVADVQRRTGAVCQVGTQQRSIPAMCQAVALVRAGRLGRVLRAVCGIGGAPASPPLPAACPPASLDWNRWLGPAPCADYLRLAGGPGESGDWSRCHYEFRWWYEYSGGKLTDWGAHHVDVATWALGKEATGPVVVDPLHVRHPVPFENGFPTVANQYNTATEFRIAATFADGVELVLQHDGDNGILFEGTAGRMFVNRGRLAGSPVEQLADQPLPDDAVEQLRGWPLSPIACDEPDTQAHVANFFAAVAARRDPVSDVRSHHRALTTCHLAGIAARLGRKIAWDPQREAIVDDPQAQSFVARAMRRGFAIET
jgi:predicted dehydrogenase